MGSEAIKGEKTVAEIASSHGISPSMVTEWKQAYLDGKLSQETVRLKKELEEYKEKYEAAQRIIGEKELEIEFLKKKTRTAF